jgi:hypothetical protein
MINRLLKTWQKQIPAMSCEAGCRVCCEGDARAMLLAEWREINHPGKYSGGRVFQTCPFLGESGCEVYARRPLICQVFGTVSREDADLQGLEVPIFCPQGCEPERPLSFAAALKIQVNYQYYAGRELQQVIGDWALFLKECGQGRPHHRTPASPEMPEKFLWLRYVLSTREGQTTLGLLAGTTKVNIDPARMEKMAGLVGG